MRIPDTIAAAPTARLEDYALLARTLVADDAAGARAVLARIAGDPALAETMRRHHLIALLRATIADVDLRACLPAAAYSALHAPPRRARPAPEENLRTIAEVGAAFARDGVEWMLLKGLYFAHRLYGGVERRSQFDVDLFVTRRGFRAASRTLLVLGFVERWRDLHSATFTRAAANIDLHSCFRSTPVYRQDEARIWRERTSYAIGDVAFATPSDEDTLVLLALSLFQDVGLGAAKLKQLLDVHLLAAAIDAGFDWAGFFVRRRAEGTLVIAVNVLDLVLRVFGAEARITRLATALTPYRGLVVAAARDQALALVFAERGAVANKGWFFRVYPGSVLWYWLWLLPRKVPTYLRGSAPQRGPSSMRPNLATLRLVLGARTNAASNARPPA